MVPAGGVPAARQCLPGRRAVVRLPGAGQSPAGALVGRWLQPLVAGDLGVDAGGLLRGHQRLAGLGGPGQLAALFLGLLGLPALRGHGPGPAPGGAVVFGRHGAGDRDGSGPALPGLGWSLATARWPDPLVDHPGGQSPRPALGPVRLRQHHGRLAGPGVALRPGGPAAAPPALATAGPGPAAGRLPGGQPLSHRFPQRLGGVGAGPADRGGAGQLALAAAPAAASDRNCGPGQPADGAGRAPTLGPGCGARSDLGAPQRSPLRRPPAPGDHPPGPMGRGRRPDWRAALAGLGGGGLQPDLPPAHGPLAWPHPQPADRPGDQLRPAGGGDGDRPGGLAAAAGHGPGHAAGAGV